MSGHTVSTMDNKDRPHFEQLLKLLDALDGWLARIDPNAADDHVEPGSALAGDDSRTDPYQTSQAVWHALSHAVDPLNCLRAVLRDAQAIHMYAPYALVRATVENACAAVWLLHPANRKDRILRRLRFAAADIINGEEAKKLIGTSGPRSLHDRLGQVRKIAERAGVDPESAATKVGYGRIVSAASEAISPSSTAVPFVWRACSGITHGDFWTTISMAERVELPGALPDVGRFRITANVQNLMYSTFFAVEMTAHGWRLFDERRRAPY